MELSGNLLTLDSINLTGTLSTTPVIISDNTTLSTKSLVLANSSSGNIILTLPNTMTGKRYYIKKNSHLNKVILYGGGNNIDNASSITLNSSSGNTYPSISVFSDDNQWYVENIEGQVSYPSSINNNVTLPFDGHHAHIDTSSNNVMLRLDRATEGSGDHIFTKTPDSYSAYISGGGNTINGSALMEITGSAPVTLSRNGDSWTSSSSSLSLPFGDNLIAYFPFKETTASENLIDLKDGHVMVPHSRNNHNLDVDGVVGSGYEKLNSVTGAKPYTINLSSEATNSDQWSISFWYKVKSAPTNSNEYSYLLFKNYVGNPDEQGKSRMFYRWGGHNSLNYHAFNNTSGTDLNTVQNIATQTWIHVVLNYNGTTFTIVINNNPELTNSDSYTNPIIHELDFFGSGGTSAILFDELYFLNRALTTDEIQLLYSVANP